MANAIQSKGGSDPEQENQGGEIRNPDQEIQINQNPRKEQSKNKKRKSPGAQIQVGVVKIEGEIGRIMDRSWREMRR